MVKFQEGQSIRALGGLRSRRDLIRTAAGGVLAASLPLFSQKQTGAAQDSDSTDIDVASITAQAISRLDDPANPKNGKLKLKDELLSGLDKEAAKVVRKFVDDVNKKKIGMAFFFRMSQPFNSTGANWRWTGEPGPSPLKTHPWRSALEMIAAW